MSQKSDFILSTAADYCPRISRSFVTMQVRETGPGDHGLYASEMIHPGQIIANDGGTVLTSIEDILSDKNHVALIDDGLWLAPQDPQNLEPVFYLNHSCSSNVARYGGLVFVAKKLISPGDQLTVDYAPMISGFRDFKIACRCQEPECRGWITSEDWKNPAVAQNLWPEWLPFIQKKILSASP